jgi:hypothetical protein
VPQYRQSLTSRAAAGTTSSSPCRRPAPDPPRRLRHYGEEDLQVIRHSQHRVRPAPARQELQVLIQQRHAEPRHNATSSVPRPGQANSTSRHARASISIRTGHSACQDPYEDHPHIMQIRASGERQAMRVAVYRSPGSARHQVATLETAGLRRITESDFRCSGRQVQLAPVVELVRTMLWTWGRGRPWGLVWCSKEAMTQCWGLTGENRVRPVPCMNSSTA